MPVPASMRAVVMTAPGDASVLTVQERPVPAVGAEQLLVRVRATALNRADILQRRGGYAAPPGAPADVLGLEYAGEVVACGPGARERRVGERVFGLVGGGGYAEYVVVHERTAIVVPDALDWREAAAVPEVFMTAHDALVQCEARPGETMLVHAAASGVGLAAVQLARAFGLVPIGTARSEAKLHAVRAYGAAATLAVTPECTRDARALAAALGDFVRTHTGGRGADVALDLVGGSYVDATAQAMAPFGRIVLIGLVAGRAGQLDFGRLLTQRLTIRGTVMRARPLEERILTARRFAREVIPLLASGAVRPTVERRFPLAEAAAAHALLESDTTVGKVVLDVA